MDKKWLCRKLLSLASWLRLATIAIHVLPSTFGTLGLTVLSLRLLPLLALLPYSGAGSPCSAGGALAAPWHQCISESRSAPSRVWAG